MTTYVELGHNSCIILALSFNEISTKPITHTCKFDIRNYRISYFGSIWVWNSNKHYSVGIVAMEDNWTFIDNNFAHFGNWFLGENL